MKNTKKWLIGIVGAALLVTALAVPAFAAGPSTDNTTTCNQNGFSMWGQTRGLGIGQVDDAVENLLGMTREEIQAERLAGKSLVEIASSKDISEEKLIDAIMAEKETAIQELVSTGKITQEIADQRLAQMRIRVEEAVNRTGVGPQSWSGASGKGQKFGVNSSGQNGNQKMGQGNGNGVNRENCTGTPGTCTGTGSMMKNGRGTK